ncbi:hypothetical protein J6590_088017 [Homalodisca vitripennis]|nr:hypothetical protein J6590_088017 [Homalodisca vitripennis]
MYARSILAKSMVLDDVHTPLHVGRVKVAKGRNKLATIVPVELPLMTVGLQLANGCLATEPDATTTLTQHLIDV